MTVWWHVTWFGIEFQTEGEANENDRSQSVAILCAGHLRRGFLYELQRVLWIFLFSAAFNWHFMVQYCYDCGSINKLLRWCFLLWKESNEVFFNVWLYYMTLEGTRSLELHCSMSVAGVMSHHELNQAAVSKCSHFFTMQKQIEVWLLLYLSGIYE